MFGGIGTGEILVLLVIALVIIGPQKLPQVARTIGRGLAELRRASYDLQRTLSLQDLDDTASKLPNPRSNERLHEKTSAEHLEVSGTKGKSTAAILSPYDNALDHVEPSAGVADGPTGKAGGVEEHEAPRPHRDQGSRREERATSDIGLDRDAAGPPAPDDAGPPPAPPKSPVQKGENP